MERIALTLVRGFAMGAADIVPGVSGGTIALIFGIYTQLLDNVRLGAKALGSLVRGRFGPGVDQLKSIDWLFIVPLALGLLAAIGLLSSLIERLLEEQAENMAGLFFGLVVASLIIAWQMIKRATATEIVIALTVGVVAFFLLGFQSAPLSDPPTWAYFLAGSIMICATILPGISGSFLLLMMGMYAAVLGDVHDRDFLNLGVMVLGMALGLSLFSTGLGWLLDHYHDQLLAALVGLMLGSLRVLWPWPHGVGLLGDDEKEPLSGTGLELPTSDNAVWPIVIAVVSCAVVLGLNSIAHRLTNSSGDAS